MSPANDGSAFPIHPHPGRLLAPDDPPPARVENRAGTAPLLLICDHAANALPSGLSSLGVKAADMQRHIAWDIGAAEVTRHLSRRFDACAVYAGYSRLVIDLNRGLDDPTLVPMISDGTIIPANRDLGMAALNARIEAFYRPYDAAVATEVVRLGARGPGPAIVSVHSFTPMMRGYLRPWHIGVLWDQDSRIADPLLRHLAADATLVVGDNHPYSGRGDDGSTLDRHAVPLELPHVLVEIRQDLISDPPGAARWAQRLYDALAPILASPEFFGNDTR
ncbi:MAG: N-formylglutamate amidohydrolase [Azospirillaceae bacterium]|nr:N-formylglutamate amidohydrolase [Azospirillaceae bacterium]